MLDLFPFPARQVRLALSRRLWPRPVAPVATGNVGMTPFPSSQPCQGRCAGARLRLRVNFEASSIRAESWAEILGSGLQKTEFRD